MRIGMLEDDCVSKREAEEFGESGEKVGQRRVDRRAPHQAGFGLGNERRGADGQITDVSGVGGSVVERMEKGRDGSVGKYRVRVEDGNSDGVELPRDEERGEAVSE
jgi:hypothetical protein